MDRLIMKLKFSGEIEIDQEIILDKIKELGLTQQASNPPAKEIPVVPIIPEPIPVKNEIETPQAKPEPIKPPLIEVGVENYTQDFYDALADDRLPEIKIPDGKTIRIDQIKAIPMRRRFRIHTGANRSNLLLGIPYYDHRSPRQSGNLMDLMSGTEFHSLNINWCNTPQQKTSQPFSPALFRAAQNPNAKWTVAIENCDTTALGRNPGFGLGFLYGGTKENHAALLNFTHCGPGLMDAKNPYPDSSLWITMRDVVADFGNESEFGGSTILTTGKIEGGKLKLTGKESAWAIANHNLDEPTRHNFAFIAHIGRFTYQIDGKLTFEDDTTIRLRPNASGKCYLKVYEGRVYFPGKEPHAGDSFMLNGVKHTIIEKNRTFVTTWTEWGNEPLNPFDDDLVHQLSCKTDQELVDGTYEVEVSSSVTGVEIDQPCYLIFKGNNDYRSYPNTTFGNREIISGSIVGHLIYNHSNVNINARNANLKGFWRQTSKDTKTPPTLVNLDRCSGFAHEFNPGWGAGADFVEFTPTKHKDLPLNDRILQLINS